MCVLQCTLDYVCGIVNSWTCICRCNVENCRKEHVLNFRPRMSKKRCSKFEDRYKKSYERCELYDLGIPHGTCTRVHDDNESSKIDYICKEFTDTGKCPHKDCWFMFNTNRSAVPRSKRAKK